MLAPVGGDPETCDVEIMTHLSRRTFMHSLAASATLLSPCKSRAAVGPILTRAIPSTGEQIPAIGLGTWITFNVGNDEAQRADCTRVMQTFFDRGGTLIDSSPMYGSSEAVIGYCLKRIKNRNAFFSATKVWTVFKAFGVQQMEASRELWGVNHFDLIQIHNLLDWSTHIETLKVMKAQRRVRYIGVTSTQGWFYGALEDIMRTQPIDFVQFSYNAVDREVEERLLPLAAERGIAVIINRPFGEGALFRRLTGHALPPWAAEIDCTTWAQFLLKFIISHPAVTCAIPATRRVEHMEDNMAVLRGRLPDAKMRVRMARHVENV
jgi:diketogulonate reductase-like aldo/keto reductase